MTLCRFSLEEPGLFLKTQKSRKTVLILFYGLVSVYSVFWRNERCLITADNPTLVSGSFWRNHPITRHTCRMAKQLVCGARRTTPIHLQT